MHIGENEDFCLNSHINSLMGTCAFDNPTAYVTLKIRSRSPKLSQLFALSLFFIQGSFKIIHHSLGFIEFQDAKFKNKYRFS